MRGRIRWSWRRLGILNALALALLLAVIATAADAGPGGNGPVSTDKTLNANGAAGPRLVNAMSIRVDALGAPSAHTGSFGAGSADFYFRAGEGGDDRLSTPPNVLGAATTTYRDEHAGISKYHSFHTTADATPYTAGNLLVGCCRTTPGASSWVANAANTPTAFMPNTTGQTSIPALRGDFDEGPHSAQSGTTTASCPSLNCKAVSVTHGSNQIIFSYAAGPGHISGIWLALTNTADPSSVATDTLTCTRDGEVTPSINAIKLEDLFDWRNELVDPKGQPMPWFHTRLYGDVPGWLHMNLPWTRSMTCSFHNSSASRTAIVWWNVYAQKDTSANWGNYAHVHGVVVSASPAAYAEQTLLDVTGTTAVLLGITASFKGGDGNFNYQEGPFKIYLNGEATPGTISSGTEDFFNLSGYGFQCSAATQVTEDDYGCTYSNTRDTINLYRWFYSFPFISSGSSPELKITWTNGVSSARTVTNATTINVVVWYSTPS